jgi:hypothetical protein
MEVPGLLKATDILPILTLTVTVLENIVMEENAVHIGKTF